MKRKLTPYWISGWSYMGRIVFSRLSPELQDQLRNVGDSVTVKKRDRYIRYVNSGLVTASSKRSVVDFHRRFRRR